MKTKLIFLTGIILSLFLVSAVSALTIVDAQWEDGSQILTITEGESATFDVYVVTYDYPMNIKIKLYDSNNQLIKTFADLTTEDYFFANAYTVKNLSAGNYQIKVSSSDKKGDTDSYTLNLKVNAPAPINHAPVITSTPIISVNESSAYTYQVTATDDDDDALTYSLTSSPNWLSINSNTGKVTGTAQDVTTDTDELIVITVSDGKGFVTQSYILTVKDVPAIIPTNHAPVASEQNLEVPRNSLGEIITLSATDSDGDTLKYSIVSNPSNGVISEFNSLTGILVYKPNRDFDGEDSFTFKANDGKSNSNIAKISMVVNGINTPTNHAPVITSTPITEVNEDSSYTYQVTATDTDEDALTYSIIQGPGWLSINQNTGKVTGTAQDVNKDSSWKVIIKVSDSKGFVTQSYILTVKDVPAIIPTNHAPVITSTPITEVNEDSSYTYQVVATDADGDTLTYSLTRNPVWLSIDSATGLITGTAPDVTEDTYVPIEILVSDGEDSTTQTYSIKVVNIEEDSGDNTIILGGKKDKERPTSLIQFDEFYTNKYLDQFSHITLDEQETDQEDTTGSNLKNILFVLASLMAIVIILGLVTILFRRL